MADEVAEEDQLFDGTDVNAFIVRFREKKGLTWDSTVRSRKSNVGK